VSITFDTGALIALERGSGKIVGLLQEIIAAGGEVHVPAGVAAQARRGGARQAVLARFFKAAEVAVEVLDLAMAQAAGELCAATGTNDVVDASVVLTARQHGDAIVTSDVGDLRKLDRSVVLERV
jgi:hypothetical protein